MALLFILGIMPAAVVAAIFVRKRISVQLLVSVTGVSVRARYFCFRLERQIAYDEFLRLRSSLRRKADSGVSVRSLLKCLKLKRIYFKSRVGIRDDAFLTALICGALEALACVSEPFFNGKPSVAHDITPKFNADSVWLYMEGIISINPGKLLLTLVKAKLKEVSKKWRIQSKTSWKKQCPSSGKWSM